MAKTPEQLTEERRARIEERKPYAHRMVLVGDRVCAYILRELYENEGGVTVDRLEAKTPEGYFSEGSAPFLRGYLLHSLDFLLEMTDYVEIVRPKVLPTLTDFGRDQIRQVRTMTREEFDKLPFAFFKPEQ